MAVTAADEDITGMFAHRIYCNLVSQQYWPIVIVFRQHLNMST
jgi:hypothetical protein